MDTSDLIDNLNEMMMAADDEKDIITLSETIKLLAKKEQHRISVPCRIGDKLYSVVGERVNTYVVAGFRIDREKTYMETEDSTFLPADRIGINYFFSRELAEREFDKKWRTKH